MCVFGEPVDPAEPMRQGQRQLVIQRGKARLQRVLKPLNDFHKTRAGTLADNKRKQKALAAGAFSLAQNMVNNPCELHEHQVQKDVPFQALASGNGSNGSSCNFFADTMAALRVSRADRPKKSSGKAVQTKSSRQQRSANRKVRGLAVNLAQKAWAAGIIEEMSFDVCQKKPKVWNWGETCADFDSRKVYGHPCGFGGMYCSTDMWGCVAKHSMNLDSIRSQVLANLWT